MLFIIILIVICIIYTVRFINFIKIAKELFLSNYLIGGLRGTGKDVLMGNSLAYNNFKSYISNVDYGIKRKVFIPLDISKLDIKNNFTNFLSGNIVKYEYPYKDNIPILISDSSLYFPSAYESELKKQYRGIVNYMPLSRHLGNNNICCNSQNASQVWDKIRNQSDKYLLCMRCKFYFKKFVFMKVRIYEKYDSFISRVPPYKKPRTGLFHKNRELIDTHKLSYMAQYGSIVSKNLFFINRIKYDSRFMKKLLENGKANSL